MKQDNPNQAMVVFKFGKREHMQEFEQGLLHMNTVDYFAKLESDYLRMDRHEGTSHSFRADLAIRVGEDFVPIAGIQEPMRWHPSSLGRKNVFCTYALRESDGETFVDPRNWNANSGFGDTYALVTNVGDFLDRAARAAHKLGHELEHGLVEYIDHTSHEGEVGIFRKPLAFSFQREFRLALSPGTGDLLRLQVGNLSDIVSLRQSSELKNQIRISRH
jgi:hypothetical protein